MDDTANEIRRGVKGAKKATVFEPKKVSSNQPTQYLAPAEHAPLDYFPMVTKGRSSHMRL
jgi:hypothetical protein